MVETDNKKVRRGREQGVGWRYMGVKKYIFIARVNQIEMNLVIRSFITHPFSFHPK